MIAQIEGRGITRARLSANNHRPTIQPELLQRYSYIPVDFIKGVVWNIDPIDLLKRPGLEFHEITNRRTGEVLKEFCIYHNMKIEIKSGRIILSGSLHKFWNDGKHNYNDFPESDFYQSLDKLYTIFGITPDQIHLTCLEVGVNIRPPISTADTINGCLIHKRRDFEQQMSHDHAKYHVCRHSNYHFKIYDKGIQYGLKHQLMRIELKAFGKHLKTMNVSTLSDFYEVDKMTFVLELINQWNEVVFADPTVVNSEEHQKYTNRLYWHELSRSKTRPTYSRHWEKLKMLNRTQGKDIQKQVSNLIVRNIVELQNSYVFHL